MEASPIEVQKALKGMDYPAKKQDLIKKAKDNDAPQKVMHVLENLPDKEFESAVDVSKEFKGEGQEGHGKKGGRGGQEHSGRGGNKSGHAQEKGGRESHGGGRGHSKED